MEPMIADSSQELVDLTLDLVALSRDLQESVDPALRTSIAAQIRLLDCRYSNLIEGHDVSLTFIEMAIRGEYSSDADTRDLQLEARAHVEVQRLIDDGSMPYAAISMDGIKWVHAEFSRRLPEAFLEIGDHAGGIIRMVPGEFRNRQVVVGKHVAPEPEAIQQLMTRYVEAYTSRMLERGRKIASVGAAHHRLAWIHPYLDGNGRVGRLVSHALLRELGMAPDLWSISRGLAVNLDQYRTLLQVADEPRRGDRDGRGNLTEAGLARFSAFFLETCIEQVEVMRDLVSRSGDVVSEMQDIGSIPGNAIR